MGNNYNTITPITFLLKKHLFYKTHILLVKKKKKFVQNQENQ